jgi:GntR family transcriptional regulator
MEEQGHTSRQDILEVGRAPAPAEVAQRLGVEEGADVVMRRLRFVVDDVPVQLVRVYYQPRFVAGSKLEQPVPIPDGVHADEEGALQLPSGVPVTRNIPTAYAGDQPVEVMDTISHGEVVSYRFEIEV